MLGKPIYKLRDWFPTNKLVWSGLCMNPNAISLLEKHWEKIQENIQLYDLCMSPNATPLLEKHWEDIHH